MRKVPRERFLPAGQETYAYSDAPLPIGKGQTISQPYIVAYMAEALALKGGEKVLEIGTGSGYAAAIIAQVAADVFTIERIATLATMASAVLDDLGYANVHVRHGDGTLGWPEEAPFDAIVVTAGGSEVPESLKRQLRIGGHLVIPVGTNQWYQELVRVTRVGEDEYRSEDLADVRFVPLIGAEGWPDDSEETVASLQQRIADACEPFESLETADLGPLLERIGDARVVLIGEASHGTSEFYRMRARITRELISQKNFRFVAIEGDWPDAARIDHFVRHFEYPPSEWVAFARFPTWMWRNEEAREFVDWLRLHNAELHPDERVAFHGLDLYSLYSSIRSILKYLDDIDPETAALARERYACLTPWQPDPANYGRAALTGTYPSCENDVVRMLIELADKHREYAEHDGERFLDAMQNARLVANAERYYRTMYYGSRKSWNLRDSYMFDTLQTLRNYHAPQNKAIVWAHNSHVGNAAATEMSARGELNIGHLCRQEFADDAYLIGFGTHTGTVAAASDWDGEMEIKTVLPSRPGSYEKMFHEVGLPGFLLGLRHLKSMSLRSALAKERLQRAIGVIYRPETELASHYFSASLPRQFDEYIWIDQTRAVQPIKTRELEGLPDTYPFGL
jgi:protein-L-isoaspartate(D-aspartate) O-methyltransferase